MEATGDEDLNPSLTSPPNSNPTTQYFLQVISIMFAGHLGELSRSPWRLNGHLLRKRFWLQRAGAAGGCGWQKMCSYINLGAYYVVGIPSAILFAFVLHVDGKGLWMGIIRALTVQVLVLLVIILRTDRDN